MNAKSPEHGLLIFIYDDTTCVLVPRSYSALVNTKILNKLTEVSLHISTVTIHWYKNFWSQQHNFLECIYKFGYCSAFITMEYENIITLPAFFMSCRAFSTNEGSYIIKPLRQRDIISLKWYIFSGVPHSKLWFMPSIYQITVRTRVHGSGLVCSYPFIITIWQ